MSTPSDLSAAAATRELAAIMFSDIAGYTLIMGRDEDKALRALAEHREVLRSVLPRFNGRMIGEIGDGTLSSFHSALDAVNCAREVQASLKDDPEMQLRIGIHVGDVLFKDNTVHGDGVNVASRIHALAPPGGVCISDRVYDEIRNKPEISVKDLGEQTLKNVSRPIRVYTLAASGAPLEHPSPAKSRLGRGIASLKRRPLASGFGVILFAALCYVLYAAFFVRIAAAVMVHVIPLLPKQMEQTVGFCRTSDGVRIAYGTVGKGAPVVIVLGWLTHVERGTSSPTYNSAFLKLIGAHHLVVQYDGRGFGMSDRGLRDYSLEPRLRDLEAVVDALKLKRFALYGISSGGPAAIAYAARHPERVTRLVLHGASAYYDLSLLSPALREKQRAFWSLVQNGWDNPAFQEMHASMMMPDASEVIRRFAAQLAEISGTPEDASAFLSAQAKIDVRQLAPQIRAPTLVINVRGDQLAPLEFGRQLADLIPGARLVIIQGRDHIPIPGDGEAEQIDPVIQPFLDEDLAKQAGAATHQ